MAKQEPKFEDVVRELETIVQELDSSIGLEESLKKFSRGMELAKVAEAQLKVIENQFEKIQHDFSAPTAPVATELTSEAEVV